MYCELDVVMGQYWQVFGIEEIFQQQDGFGLVQLVQVNGIIWFDQCQVVGIGEVVYGVFQFVIVVVGFEYFLDVGVGCMGVGDGKIVLKCGNVDGSDDWFWYDIQWQ